MAEWCGVISVSCFEVGFCESNVCFRGVSPLKHTLFIHPTTALNTLKHTPYNSSSKRCNLCLKEKCPTFRSKQCCNARWTWQHENLTHFLSTNCTLTDLSGMVTPLMNGSTFSASGGKEMSNRCMILVISRWSSNSAIRRPRYIRVPNPNEREAKASADSIKAVSLFRNHLSGLNASASSKILPSDPIWWTRNSTWACPQGYDSPPTLCLLTVFAG